MPVGWFLKPFPIVPAALGRAASQETVPPTGALHSQSGSFTYEGTELSWVSDSAKFDLERQVRTLDGHVKITYGKEVLSADHIEAHLAPEDLYLIARSRILLTDPDGSIVADNLKISWKKSNQFAHADHATVVIASVTIRAESIDMTPDQWVLTKFDFTPERGRKPFYHVKGDQAIVKPGHDVLFKDPQLYVLGQRILGFHSRILNLDPKASGMRLPTPEYRGGNRFGYNWAGSTIVDRQTILQLHDSLSVGELPGYGALIDHSFVPIAKDSFPISPRSEFQLRFDFGYFENVFVDAPSSEINYLQRSRSSISAETTFNSGVSGRGDGEGYTVPASLQYEFGTKLGSNGYLSELKLESIDAYRGPYIERAEWLNSLELTPKKISDKLYEMTRIDSGVFQSTQNFFWVRGTEGLVFKPDKALTLGASIFGSLDGGTPIIDIDPLYYRNGAAGRADYHLDLGKSRCCCATTRGGDCLIRNTSSLRRWAVSKDLSAIVNIQGIFTLELCCA
jgi:hypothetical protein